MSLRTLPIFLVFFAMGFVDAMGPLASTIQKQYSLSGFMAGLLPAFAFVAFAIFSVPGGVLTARIGKKNMMLLALALVALGVLVPTVVVPGFALLLAGVFVLGVGTTLLQVAGNPIMRDVSGEGRFASNLSLAQFVKGVGSVVSTFLVGRLAVGELGWRRIFPVFLALTVVALLSVLALKVKETRAEAPPSVGSSVALLGEPAFGLAVLGIFLYVGAEVGMNTWLGPRLQALGFTADNLRFAGLDWGRESTALGSTLFFVGLTVGRLLGSGILSVVSARAFFRLSARARRRRHPACRRACRGSRSPASCSPASGREHLAGALLAHGRGTPGAQRGAVGLDVDGDLRRRRAASADGPHQRHRRPRRGVLFPLAGFLYLLVLSLRGDASPAAQGV